VKNSLMLGAGASALVLLAGCGGSNGYTTANTTTGAATTSSAAATTGGSAYGHAGGRAASASTPSGVQVTSKSSKLGTVLAAGPKRMTVYLFEADRGASSACSGACASAWPPVTTSAAPSSAGAASASELGTITRADGAKQVTYKGHPLYYFSRDKDAGDAYGQGSTAFGAGWYVLAPSGGKIDHS
jgi:predicted lipoprotein with Yx(FWY)xxD motif